MVGGVLVGIHTAARRLTADQAHRRIADELIKQPYSIAAATYTSQQRIGKPALLLQQLGPHLPADNALEIPHNGGERMGAHHGAQYIMGVVHPGSPFPHGFVDRVLQGTGAALHRVNLGPSSSMR